MLADGGGVGAAVRVLRLTAGGGSRVEGPSKGSLGGTGSDGGTGLALASTLWVKKMNSTFTICYIFH